jgi:hypothetical protein
MSALKLNSPGGGSISLLPPNTPNHVNVTLPNTDIILSEVSTTNVLAATAAAGVGAVGTYALLRSNATHDPGSTSAGSALDYVGLWDTRAGVFATAPVGTWRCMGYSSTTSDIATLWLRIS